MMSLSRHQKTFLISTVAIGAGSLLLWYAWKNREDEEEYDDDDDEDGMDDTVDPMHHTKPARNERRILPKNVKYISHSDVKNLLTTTMSSDQAFIDVRDTEIDGSGGNIYSSINIPHKTFYDAIPELIKKYNNASSVIVYCMYGARRSVKCVEYYAKAKAEIINNYSSETNTSFFYKYRYKAAPNDNNDPSADDSAIGMIIKHENDTDDKWRGQHIDKTKVDINDVDDRLIENLVKQRIFILEGGYFSFFNNSIIDIKNKLIIQNFDGSKWEQLELIGVHEKKMWYHTNEYFAKAKFQEFKEANKSANFKLNSSAKEFIDPKTLNIIDE